MLCVCACMLSRFSCVQLWDPMDCCPPDSSLPGILQARILELGCHALLQGIFRPRDQICISCSSCTAGRFFTTEPWGKPNVIYVQCSVAQSCPTLCDPMTHSTLGLPVHHQLPEFTQTHVHWVGDVIQPSHPLSSPSPPALNPSQHQALFQWVNSSHQVAKVLEFQLQHQSFQWTPRTDLL